MFQQLAAFGMVGLAMCAAFFHFYKGYVAKPLSSFFLKKGKVKLAMKMRAHVEESGCGSCGTDSNSSSSCHPGN